ncbi:MAG: radical SAM protein [Thermovenabulum sp.]|uniref:radical SAM protein n=1 Tax=Thermovenabulum sp. TaxID=3100335 RepID=UPI003C7A9BD1
MTSLNYFLLNELQKNGVKVNYISTIGYPEDDEFIQIEIISKENDINKWKYFNNKLNDEKIKIYTEKAKDYYKILYKMSEKSINNFLLCINKKYHTVAPVTKRLTALIKPTHMCNMDCLYCYEKPARKKYGNLVMSHETLEKIIKMLSEYTERLELIWHGGEPTMAGKEWYIKAYNIISKYPMLKIDSNIMTNGINVSQDDEWYDIFNFYNIKIGMSYNALEQSKIRPTEKDKKNYDLADIIKSAREKGVEIGIIDVITLESSYILKEKYEYYKSLKVGPCFNTIFYTKEADKNNLLPRNNEDIKKYTENFLEFFKYWLRDKNGIYERTCAEYLQMVVNGTGTVCNHTHCQRQYINFNANGDVYPCDRYMPEKYKMGNVHEVNGLKELYNSYEYRIYVEEKAKRMANYCSKCELFGICHGGCNATAIETNGNGEKPDPDYCYFAINFYKGIYNIVKDIIFYEEENINPKALEIITDKNYYSIKEIKELIGDMVNIVITNKEQNDDIFSSAEYLLHKEINHHYFRKKNNIKTHLNMITPYGYNGEERKEIIEKNKTNRKISLIKTLKEVVINDIVTS